MTPFDRQEQEELAMDDATPLREVTAVLDLFDALGKLLLDQLLTIPKLGTLTFAHLRLLYLIKVYTPMTLEEIRRVPGCSSVATRRLIRDLVRHGLLERCGDLFDQRRLYLRLSNAGSAFLSQLEANQRRCCRTLLSRLSPEEQDTVARGLSLLLPPE